MADPTDKSKKRKLRQASETVRERAERLTETGNKPKRTSHARSTLKRPFMAAARQPLWRPFKFVGRYIVPPYLRSSWRELRQVTWPSGKQTRQLTSAVIIFSVAFGILVAAFDYGLDKLFKQVIIK